MNGEFDIIRGCLNLVAFIFSVGCYTITQLIMHGKFRLQGKFWNKDSWENKYRMPLEPASGWYYKLLKITYRERFPGSASFFVSVTDAYHLFQLFFKLLLCASIVTYKNYFGWYDAIGYFILFSIVFSIAYYVFDR